MSPAKSESGNNTFNVNLTTRAIERFDQIVDQRGMKQKTLASMVIEWFCSLDRTQQTLILDGVEGADALVICESVLRRCGQVDLAEIVASRSDSLRGAGPRRSTAAARK